MHIIMVEPLLKDRSGHQFSNTTVLKSEFEDKGVFVSVLGNIDADEECLKIKNFYPYLTDITPKIYQMRPTPWSIYRVVNAFRCLSNQFDDFFFSKMDLRKQKNTVVFLCALFIFELLAFGWFLRKRKKLFVANNHKIIIGLNYTCKRKSFFATAIMGFLFKYIFANLVKKISSQIIYFSLDEAISKDYEKLLKTNVNRLYSPANNRFLEYYNNSKKSTKEEKIIISYVGGTRYNKGFDIFATLVEVALKKEEIRQKILFFVQIDIQMQSEKHKKLVFESVNAIENLAKKFENVKLIHGSISIEEYYDLLSRSDIVVLPYRKEFYKSIISNIFRETILLGNVPIVSDGTEMASILMKYNLEDLIMKHEDMELNIEMLKKIINNIEECKSKIQEIQNEWRRLYSASELVNKLLALVV